MNKKIKNACSLEFDGIKFKSKLEVMAYKTLKEHNLNAIYEPITFRVWEGFKPTIPYYSAKVGDLKLDNKKLIDIKYTPDFIIEDDNVLIVIEMKGFCNDTYYLHKKLFRKYLETINKKIIFFEVRTKKQLLQAINIIYEFTRDNKESK